jgi:hypothetical protein
MGPAPERSLFRKRRDTVVVADQKSHTGRALLAIEISIIP